MSLPLSDRTHKTYPLPCRQHGGDVVGYESVGYNGPPEVDNV